MNDFQRFITELKRIVDDNAPEGAYQGHGPMRVRLYSFVDDKKKERRGVKVEAGYDYNYGGKVCIEASPTGKSLKVYVSPEVKVEKL